MKKLFIVLLVLCFTLPAAAQRQKIRSADSTFSFRTPSGATPQALMKIRDNVFDFTDSLETMSLNGVLNIDKSLTAGSGLTQAQREANRDSLKNLADRALANDLALYVPPGKRYEYHMETGAGNNSVINIGVSDSNNPLPHLVIMCQAPYSTFKMYPDTAPADDFFFMVISDTMSLTVMGGIFVGQGTAGTTNTSRWFNYNAFSGGEIRLYDVYVRDFDFVLNIPGSSVDIATDLYAEASYFHAYQQPISFFTNGGTDTDQAPINSLHLVNCWIIGDINATSGHLVYTNLGTNLAFYGCKFDSTGATKYSIHDFSGAIDKVRERFVVEDCYFGREAHKGILVDDSGADKPVIIRGNFFENQEQSLVLQTAKVRVTDNTFDQYSPTTLNTVTCLATADSLAGSTLLFQNNYWYGGTMQWGANDGTWDGVSVEFKGDRFYEGDSAGTRNILSENDSINFYFDNVQVFDNTGTFAEVHDGRVVLRNSQFHGAGTALDFRDTNGRAEIWNNYYSSNLGIATNAPSAAGVIYGGGNWYESSVQAHGGSYAFVELGRGVDPDTVASASNVTINENFNFVFISGTTQINNIRVANSTEEMRGFVGSLHIVPTGTFTFGSSGNINAPAGAVTVDRVYTLYFDSIRNKWYAIDF